MRRMLSVRVPVFLWSKKLETFEIPARQHVRSISLSDGGRYAAAWYCARPRPCVRAVYTSRRNTTQTQLLLVECSRIKTRPVRSTCELQTVRCYWRRCCSYLSASVLQSHVFTISRTFADRHWTFSTSLIGRLC